MGELADSQRTAGGRGQRAADLSGLYGGRKLSGAAAAGAALCPCSGIRDGKGPKRRRKGAGTGKAVPEEGASGTAAAAGGSGDGAGADQKAQRGVSI